MYSQDADTSPVPCTAGLPAANAASNPIAGAAVFSDTLFATQSAGSGCAQLGLGDGRGLVLPDKRPDNVGVPVQGQGGSR